MRAGHEQNVPGEQRPDVEEGHRHLVVEHDVGGRLAGHDLAEDAGHGRILPAPCGYGSAATGPFYCPGDSKVYIDLSFFDEMDRRLGAPGDFAQAYVVAHEVGHHVQNLLGISDRVHAARERVSDEEYNQLSVRLELQADFLAGVWAHHAQQNWQILEEGDIEEALDAATAIGDDRLQRQAQGYVQRDVSCDGHVTLGERGRTPRPEMQGATLVPSAHEDRHHGAVPRFEDALPVVGRIEYRPRLAHRGDVVDDAGPAVLEGGDFGAAHPDQERPVVVTFHLNGVGG